jgi:hypothetical protein
MKINSDINVLGSLPDLNLISIFMNESIKSLNQNSGHYSYTTIKTDKSVKRFEKAITNTMLRFSNKKIEVLFRSILSVEIISADSLLMIFWNTSFNNQLLNYLNEKVYFPALYSGRVAIKQPEVSACLTELKETEPELKKWADSTIEVTASKYLTLLKKFNLMSGSLNKSINNNYLNDKMFILFVYWILAVETKSNILESTWLDYCFLERKIFIERIMNKKFSKYINIYFTGDNLKIEPIIEFENIYYEITKS